MKAKKKKTFKKKVYKTKGRIYGITDRQEEHAWAKLMWIRQYGAGTTNSPDISANPGAKVVQTFRANSIYDPDFTSGSINDSSAFWISASQLGNKYLRYCVHACKVTIQGYCRNNGATNLRPNRIYLIASNQSSPPTDETGMMIQPRYKMKYLDPSIYAYPKNRFKLTLYFKIKDLLKRTSGLDEINDGGLINTSNPTYGVYIHVIFWCAYANNTADAAPYYLTYTAKIKYFTHLFDRQQPSNAQYQGTNVPV